MSTVQLKKFAADHHLKLWACGLGILVVISLAAATPPLSHNSVVSARGTTGSANQIKQGGGVLKIESGVGPLPSKVRGHLVSGAAIIASDYPGGQPNRTITPVIPASSKTPSGCPLAAGPANNSSCGCSPSAHMIACAPPNK